MIFNREKAKVQQEERKNQTIKYMESNLAKLEESKKQRLNESQQDDPFLIL